MKTMTRKQLHGLEARRIENLAVYLAKEAEAPPHIEAGERFKFWRTVLRWRMNHFRDRKTGAPDFAAALTVKAVVP